MKIDLSSGLLTSAHYLASSHCDERPKNTLIDMIVIHNISLPPNEFGTQAVEKFFCGSLDFSLHPFYSTIKELKVAAHLFIDRDGKVTQFVPFSKRAWHAGKSYFQGQENCNDFSIGIELEGTDTLPFEKIQYERLSELVRLLRSAYPTISRDRIVGHSDVAPGRKTDPGPHFDWSYLDCLLDA